jgi:hypothetical protein
MMLREALLCLGGTNVFTGPRWRRSHPSREHRHSKSVVWALRTNLHPKMRTNNSATGRNGSTCDANNCRDNSNGRDTHTDTHNKAGRRSRLARKLQPSQWRARPRPDRREKTLRTIPASANCTGREASSTKDWDSVPHHSLYRQSSSHFG